MATISFEQSDRMIDLYALSQGPNQCYRSWNSCIVNGVCFHNLTKDNSHRT